jgi:hypothetical protein
MWKKDSLYRLPRGSLSTQNFNLNDKIYSKSENRYFTENQLKSRVTNFEVVNVFQGILFKMEDTLYYVPDSDKSTWQTLASSVTVFGHDSNTVFWMDDKHNLFSYNFLLKLQESFGKMAADSDFSDIKIHYYKNWNRIFVYTKTNVFSIWFDKDLINSSVLKYSNVVWVDSAMCLPKVVDKFQSCIKDNRLTVFKNTSIW